MIDITTSKEPVRCYIEAGDGDSGAVVCYLKQVGEHEYVAHREWYSDPAMAKQQFAGIDVQRAEEKAALIEAKIAPVEESIKTVKGG
jgi:hypothetical protein